MLTMFGFTERRRARMIRHLAVGGKCLSLKIKLSRISKRISSKKTFPIKAFTFPNDFINHRNQIEIRRSRRQEIANNEAIYNGPQHVKYS